MTDFMLQIYGLSKSYDQHHVLDQAQLNVKAGEIVAIQGASGTGKSTLLNIVGLLDDADDGEVIFKGRDILSLPAAEQRQLRNQEIGFIFQAYHLLPEFSILENICMPLRCQGSVSDADIAFAKQLLAHVDLAQRADDLPRYLSGGERQRVAVCRALVTRPALILADEPTGNLDPETTQKVLHQLFQLARESDASVLLVSHDTNVCDQADRIVQLRDHALHELTATERD